jgi:hypothetical protein
MGDKKSKDYSIVPDSHMGNNENLIGKSYKEAPEIYISASPVTYISKDIPPTLSFQGTLDKLAPYE